MIIDCASHHLVALSEESGRAEQSWLEVDVDSLPVFRVHFEYLVIDPDMIIVLDGFVPLVPSFLVQVAIREAVDVVCRAPITKEQQLGGTILVLAGP